MNREDENPNLKRFCWQKMDCLISTDPYPDRWLTNYVNREVTVFVKLIGTSEIEPDSFEIRVGSA